MSMFRRKSFCPDFLLSPPVNPRSTVLHTKQLKRSKEDDDHRYVNQYLLRRSLGSGSYGRIRLAIVKSKQVVVLQVKGHENKEELFALKILSKSLLRKKRDFGRSAVPVNVEATLPPPSMPPPMMPQGQQVWSPVMNPQLPMLAPMLDSGIKPALRRPPSISITLDSSLSLASIDSLAKSPVPRLISKNLTLPGTPDSSVPRTPGSRRNSNAPPPLLSFGVITALDKLKKEIEIMQDLIHPNIVSLYEIINDDLDDKIYMVCELCRGGQIMTWNSKDKKYENTFFSKFNFKSKCFGGLPQIVARKFFRQLVLSLKYIHENRVVHRDLKPDNILLYIPTMENNFEDISIKVGDFGVAHRFSADPNDKFLSDSSGTYSFISPEACTGMPFDAYIADIWSLGATLFTMVFGGLPFKSENASELFDLIQYSPLVFPVFDDKNMPDTSDPNQIVVQDLLSKLLDKSPSTRITLDEILVHPWLSESADFGLFDCVKSYWKSYDVDKDFALDSDDIDYDSD